MFIISTLYADAPAAAPNPVMQFVPIILVFVVMYFFMIRPQSKKTQEHKAMIDALQRGANVMTSGGIFGTVAQIQDDKAIISVAEGVEITVLKSAIASVLDSKTPLSKSKNQKSKKAASAE